MLLLFDHFATGIVFSCRIEIACHNKIILSAYCYVIKSTLCYLLTTYYITYYFCEIDGYIFFNNCNL